MQTTTFRLAALLLAVCIGQTSLAGTIVGTYEFTDNSLAVTDADAGDGITLSDFSINSYTTDEAFSAGDAAVADVTLDAIDLNGVESPNGTGSAFADGLYLSFTVTNNSGSLVSFEKLTADFNKNNVFQQFRGRIYTSNPPASVADDTIARLGVTSGGFGAVSDEAFLDGTAGGAGANFAGVPITLADNASVTFYWAPNMASNSTARSMAIDNIAVHIIPVPEPSTSLLLIAGAAAVAIRRRG